MGVAFEVNCSHCGFEKAVYDDYGGIYDYYTYECYDCKDYFTISTEQKEEELPSLEKMNGKRVIDFLMDSILKYYHKEPLGNVKCEYCKGTNIERITYQPNGKWHVDNIRRPCPKCKTMLNIGGELWFDD